MIIQTSHGNAHVLHIPAIAILKPHEGVILWGRCDRIPMLTNVIPFAKHALWIADYAPKLKCAIIVWAVDPAIVGEHVEFDTSFVEVRCPKCDRIDPLSNGRSLWRCKGCGKQWKK